VLFLNSLQEYGIRGFPTIKVFVPGKPPVDYQGARDVKPIAEFALQQVCWNLFFECFNILAQKFQSNVSNMYIISVTFLDIVHRCLLFCGKQNIFLCIYEKLNDYN
jgi:hypothetical protein